jgi:type IV pilus assembly protein PilE
MSRRPFMVRALPTIVRRFVVLDLLFLRTPNECWRPIGVVHVRKTAGFTLMEVLIAMAILAILASIAIPSYSDYVLRGRISEATATLSDVRIKLEQHFQDNRTYAGTAAFPADATTACPANIAPADAGLQSFNIRCSGLSATVFTVQAVGKGTMTGFTYQVIQSGARSTEAVPTGWTGSATCWVTKKGGAC